MPLYSMPLSAVLFKICKLCEFRWPVRLCQRLASCGADIVIPLSVDARASSRGGRDQSLHNAVERQHLSALLRARQVGVDYGKH